MNYVADKLDLKKDIQFSTVVKSAEWDQQRSSWRVSTDSGQKIECQYLVSCTGMLSAPLENVFPGQDKFEGDIFHTARWRKNLLIFQPPSWCNWEWGHGYPGYPNDCP